MNNVNILQVRPSTDSNSQGAFISYSMVLKPSNHSLNGSFNATTDEVKEAVNNNSDGNWNGFKQLAVNRILNDIQTLRTDK